MAPYRRRHLASIGDTTDNKVAHDSICNRSGKTQILEPWSNITDRDPLDAATRFKPSSNQAVVKIPNPQLSQSIFV
ncbi:UNVERIFIED_CONTAM: hypothetical protein Sradi_6975400 [Sesamum radiatum]|uniref:Uncharacterized protein n=1 Tax=Sesamum radiatum TaxID=300843 RepID=A0AAW2JEU2_SESRA